MKGQCNKDNPKCTCEFYTDEDGDEEREEDPDCPVKGQSKDNEECTCKHDAGYFRDETEANPDCPVRGHTDPVRSVCFSPCGEKIASGGGNVYGNKDYSIRIWDAKTGDQI